MVVFSIDIKWFKTFPYGVKKKIMEDFQLKLKHRHKKLGKMLVQRKELEQEEMTGGVTDVIRDS